MQIAFARAPTQKVKIYPANKSGTHFDNNSVISPTTIVHLSLTRARTRAKSQCTNHGEVTAME